MVLIVGDNTIGNLGLFAPGRYWAGEKQGKKNQGNPENFQQEKTLFQNNSLH
jgi:hypothetical protein